MFTGSLILLSFLSPQLSTVYQATHTLERSIYKSLTPKEKAIYNRRVAKLKAGL